MEDLFIKLRMPLKRYAYSYGGYRLLGKNGLYGFLNAEGKTAVPFCYEEAIYFSEEMAAVRKDGKWGYVDKSGEMVIKPSYAEAEKGFFEGRSVVRRAGAGGLRYGVIDREGDTVVDFLFEDFGVFHEGTAPFLERGRWGFMDTEGDVVLPPVWERSRNQDNAFTFPVGFSNSLAAVEKEGKWGYINPSGEFVIPPEYDNVLAFNEGRGVVMLGGRWGVVNGRGECIVPCEYDGIQLYSEGLAAAVKKTGDGGYKWGFLDKEGNTAIPFVFDAVHPFSEGLAGMFDPASKKWGFIDKSGTIALKPEFNRPYAFVGGLSYVEEEGAYIDQEGKRH